VEASADGLSDILSGVYAAMMTVPLDSGYYPERWKQVINGMLEKIPGVSRSDKLSIIQLLEADLHQVLRISFARNILKLPNNHSGIISDHQYGRSHQTCMTPVLDDLLMVQLLIQKKTTCIVFDNDAKGSYDRIVSGIALMALRCIGYSKNSVKMLGLIGAELGHHVCTWYGISDMTTS
jgi:hypothetical protein